jgi:uncharacterized metal-binding protein
MDKSSEFKCAFCGVRLCCTGDEKKYPSFCPMPVSAELIAETHQTYLENEEIRSLALESARIESEGYCQWTRLEEIINFARRLGAKNIGIAHCDGLAQEAKIVHQIMESLGFTVNSVRCKVGNLDKEKLGLTDEEKVRPGQYESACNPIAQAKLLAEAGCELNIVIGLCVGHDSLFFLHAKAPTTVLIAKDRVLGHNPAAALYTSHSYYKRLKK